MTTEANETTETTEKTGTTETTEATETTETAGSGSHRSHDGGTESMGAALTCAYCQQQFERERYLALHRGLRHRDALSEAELGAFEDAREVEERELQRFRLKALIALVALYFGLLMAYAVFS